MCLTFPRVCKVHLGTVKVT